MNKSNELKDKIDNWAARGQKWTKEGQVLALSVLAHIEEHGDVTLANRLLVGMPKGTKRNAMAEWMLAFGKLQINTDKEAAKTSPLLHDKAKTTNMVEAAKKQWFDFQPEKEVAEVFDIQKAVAAIIARAAKATTVTDPAMLEALQGLVHAEVEAHAGGDTEPGENEEGHSTDPLAQNAG